LTIEAQYGSRQCGLSGWYIVLTRTKNEKGAIGILIGKVNSIYFPGNYFGLRRSWRNGGDISCAAKLANDVGTRDGYTQVLLGMQRRGKEK